MAQLSPDQPTRRKTPKRINDPRDKKDPQPPRPTGGSIPGVGYRLLPGARTTRGHVINQDAHPTGSMTKEEATGAGITAEQMATRWPDYAQGYALHSEAGDMLEELWAARQVPGLSVEDHAKFSGRRTAEEEYDFRATGDPRVLDAFGKLAGLGKPAEAPGLDLAKDIAALPAEEKAALSVIVAALSKGGAE